MPRCPLEFFNFLAFLSNYIKALGNQIKVGNVQSCLNIFICLADALIRFSQWDLYDWRIPNEDSSLHSLQYYVLLLSYNFATENFLLRVLQPFILAVSDCRISPRLPRESHSSLHFLFSFTSSLYVWTWFRVHKTYIHIKYVTKRAM